MLEQQKMPSFTYFGSRAHSLPAVQLTNTGRTVWLPCVNCLLQRSAERRRRRGGGSSAKSYARMNLSFRSA